MNIRIESPFPFEALPRLWRWMEPFRSKVADDFSPKTLDEFILSMVTKWDTQKTWAVYADSEMGGLVSFEKFSPWVGTAHFMLKSQFQRKGISIVAARLAAAEIFESEGVGKLVFHPLSGNLAIGSLLANLGAKREGTLVGHTLLNGEPTDMWVYGLSKKEFEAYASSNHSGRNRRGVVDPGRDPVQTENGGATKLDLNYQHVVDPYIHTGGVPGPTEPAQLLERPAEGSVGGNQGDQ